MLEIAVQVLIMFFGGVAFQVTRVGGCEWGISLALGIVSIPLGSLIGFIPDEPFITLFSKKGHNGRLGVPTPGHNAERWRSDISLDPDNLSTFVKPRGPLSVFGRLSFYGTASCLRASCDAITAIIFSSQARAFSLLRIDLGQTSADHDFSNKWEEYRISITEECKIILSLDIPLIA